MQSCFSQILVFTLVSLGFVPTLIETVGSPQTFQKITGFPSEHFLFISVFFFYLLTFRHSLRLNAIQNILFFVNFLVSGVLASILSLAEFATPANTVYSLTRVNPDKLFFISMAAGAIWFGSLLPLSQVKFRIFGFLLSVYVVFSASIMWTWPFEKMYLLTKEDSLTEYSQFFTLIVGSIFSFKLATILKKSSLFFSILYFFTGWILLLVAGDEISWGQRIFNLETPEEFKSINTQQEITFHNIYSYEIYVTYGYILLGLFGSVISFVARLFIKKPWRNFTFPPAYLFLFFFIPFVIQSSHFYLSGNNFKGFAEISELMLYLGITLFLAELYFFPIAKKPVKAH